MDRFVAQLSYHKVGGGGEEPGLIACTEIHHYNRNITGLLCHERLCAE